MKPLLVLAMVPVAFLMATMIACGNAPRDYSHLTPNPETYNDRAHLSTEDILATRTASGSRATAMAEYTPEPTSTPDAARAKMIEICGDVRGYDCLAMMRRKERQKEVSEILERRRVAMVIAREGAEAANEKSRKRAASSHVNERYCQFRSDFSLKIIQHILGVPVLDAETVLDCKFAISVAKNYLADCEKTGTELWTRWKIRPTPVNHHVHTHHRNSEQEELVIECRPHDVRTGIDVNSTKDMVVFVSDHDRLCHSHPHEHVRGEVDVHPHCHSHEDDGEEHLHGHDDHKHYEKPRP